MGRYKERETTRGLENIIPPFLYSFEIGDTKTGRIGEGHGYTKREARDNAWKDLKYGREPRYREDRKPLSIGASGGGEGVPISTPFPEAEGLAVGFILGLTLICMLIIGLCKGCEYIVLQADRGINKIYPAYETREEGFLEHTQKWERWNRFAQGSERWLLVSETTPATPQGKIIFISQVNGNQRIYWTNLRDRKQVRLTRQSTGRITSYALSPDGKRLAFTNSRDGKESKIYVMNPDGTGLAQIKGLNSTIEASDKFKIVEVVWRSPAVILSTRQNHPYSKTIWSTDLRQDELEVMTIPSLSEYNTKWVTEGSKEHWPTFYSCEDPSVSLDGEKLAYVRSEYLGIGLAAVRAKGQIIVMDLQQGIDCFSGGPTKQVCVADLTTAQLGPQAWSPDSTKIVFSAVDKGGKDRIGIWELSKRSWFEPKITWLRVSGKNPAWSPGGKWIAFDNEGEIYIFEIATSKAKTYPNSIGFLTGSEARIVDGKIGRVIRGEKLLWVP